MKWTVDPGPRMGALVGALQHLRSSIHTGVKRRMVSSGNDIFQEQLSTSNHVTSLSTGLASSSPSGYTCQGLALTNFSLFYLLVHTQ